MARLILASSSPRRRELLEQLGLVFDIYSPDIDESVQAGESVAHYVERLACAKAEAVQLQYPDAIVIAADTSLGVDQEILVNLNLSSMHLKCGEQFLAVSMMYILQFVSVQIRKFQV